MIFFPVFLSLCCLMPSVFASEKIHINRADAAQLASALSGVGEKKAQKIVAWRQQHGDFKSIEDLAQIQGFGAKLIERNQHLIDFTPSASLPFSQDKAHANGAVVSWPRVGVSR